MKRIVLEPTLKCQSNDAYKDCNYGIDSAAQPSKDAAKATS